MTGTVCFSELFVAAWPVIFGLDLSRYVIAASGLAIILAIFARHLAHRCIQNNRATAADIRREITFSLSTVLLFSLVGFGVYLGSQTGLFQIYRGDLPSVARLLLEFAAIVVLHDAYFYCAHRAMHTRWLFRQVHRLHHRSRTPTPWAAYSFAPPIELFPSWWLRVPFLRCITTTTHHDLHHSHGGYNFGFYFTWWDRWMNTEHPQYANRFNAVTQSRDPITQPVKETRQ